MTESIKTERYRLALIAHHAEVLAKLMNEQNGRGKAEWWFGLSYISPYNIMTIARTINKHLNGEGEVKECSHKTEDGYCTVFERECDANTCNPYCCEYEAINK